jgi:hypothetical protein
VKRFPLRIKEEAIHDIRVAYVWYEKRSIGLGERFLEAIDVCFSTIKNQPKAFQEIYKGQRQAVIKTFPFVVLYHFNYREIIVFAVFNTHQHPHKKHRQ